MRLGCGWPRWRSRRPGAQHAMIIPLKLRLGHLRARLFSTIATLGTAQDVTLQELRIEASIPPTRRAKRCCGAPRLLRPDVGVEELERLVPGVLRGLAVETAAGRIREGM